MSTQAGEKKWYTGGCHCGATRYEVNLDASNISPTRCNCSICYKRGYALLMVNPEDLKLITPATVQELGDYTFGTGRIHHRFCKTCAVTCVAEGKVGAEAMFMINALSIDQDQGIELKDVKFRYFNGKAIQSIDKFEKKPPAAEPFPGGYW